MIMNQNIREHKAYPIVESLLRLYLGKQENLIIEGDNFNVKDWLKYRNTCESNVKMCVCGYGNITARQKIEINTNTTNIQSCWFEPLSIGEKTRIAQEMIDRSVKMRKEVDKINDISNIRYFDSHPNFKASLAEAMEFCLAG